MKFSHVTYGEWSRRKLRKGKGNETILALSSAKCKASVSVSDDCSSEWVKLSLDTNPLREWARKRKRERDRIEYQIENRKYIQLQQIYHIYLSTCISTSQCDSHSPQQQKQQQLYTSCITNTYTYTHTYIY